jgi:hypothetical protein
MMANFSAIPGRPLAALGTHRDEIPAVSSYAIGQPMPTPLLDRERFG